MFEISWSELLILAVVTLIFVGPKELPAFFNMLGRYAGMVRRHASEFRSHFETAMREAEFDRFNKEVMNLQNQVTDTVRDAERAAETGATEIADKAGGAAEAAGAAAEADDKAPAGKADGS